MAGANMKDIKNRIKSVESTMQITKAMELVASSKLRKARERVENSRGYFNTLYAALVDISRSNTDLSSPYVIQRPIKKVCYVLIAGDRGLAGGYNSNVFKAVTAHMEDRAVCVLPIGKKAVEYCERRGWEILSKDYAIAEDVSFDDCDSISQILCKGGLTLCQHALAVVSKGVAEEDNLLAIERLLALRNKFLRAGSRCGSRLGALCRCAATGKYTKAKDCN